MSSTEIRTTKKRTTVGSGPTVIVSKTPVSMVRTSMGGGGYGIGGGNVIHRSVRQSTYAAAPGLKPGVIGEAARQGVNNVVQKRDQEKVEMGKLNTKLINYIEMVKYLEGNCKALTIEIENLKKSKGYEQKRVLELVEEEMRELRDKCAELEKKMAPLDSKIIAKDDEIETQQERIKDLEDEIKNMHAKLRELFEQNEDVEAECKRLKHDNDQLAMKNKSLLEQVDFLTSDNRRLRTDLERAIAEQIEAQQRAAALEEELEFSKQCWDEECIELKDIIASQKSNPVDVQGMWKKNFASAMNNLQDQYKIELENSCAEMKRQYDERIQTIQMGINKDNTDAAIAKTESKTLKSQLGEKKNRLGQLELDNENLRKELQRLRDEMEEEREDCHNEKSELSANIDGLNDELRDMMEQMEGLKDQKLSLDMEIACYRKLIDGEERKYVFSGGHLFQGPAFHVRNM